MKDIKPNYYRRTINGVEIDVNDIADAFDLGYHAQNAIKYLVRAGRKDEKSLVDDLVKARHYIDRLIKKHEDAERLALYEQIEDRNHAFRSFDRSEVAAIVADYAKDLGPLVQETNPETITEAPRLLDEVTKPVVLLADPPAVATAWPCWVFRRLAVREYNIAGPYPTREAARRALDPGRTDERVVMADDPYQVEADVIERLFA